LSVVLSPQVTPFCYPPSELTVLGELRQEGLLMEQHNKQRLVLLFATMLIITKQKEDGRLQFKTYISVSLWDPPICEIPP